MIDPIFRFAFRSLQSQGYPLAASFGFLFLCSLLPAMADERIDYQKQVKPILVERCIACHGALKQRGGLRLDTAALAIKGGDSGTAIIPGDTAGSLLLTRVSAAEASERMPPEGEALKADQIAVLRKWIEQRAEAPANEQPERHPREHWAFRTPIRPAMPLPEQLTEEQARWQLNPIDAFVASEQRKHGVTPQSSADKRVWLRRVSLDLIGLPPAPEEVEAFLADQSPEAHEKVVSQLLDNPLYGERWGRHWMDIWRYSDWWGLGAEVRNSQKHIWHWRDWIVESVNSDKGYDQMLREMLAADELYPNDLDRLRATGYLARQYFIFNRTTWLDETIEHTAKGMLGLTFNCAKCHDHKYDPLLQTEYYQLRAIFEPYQIRAEMVPGQSDYEKDGIPRAFDAHLDVPTYLHLRGDDRNPDKSRVINPAVPEFLSSDDLKLAIKQVALPPEAAHPGLRDFAVKTHREAGEQVIAAARTALNVAKMKLEESQKGASASGDPAKSAPLPIDQAQLAMSIAEKAVKTAEDQLASVEARAAADRAKVAQTADMPTLILAASKSERIFAASRAEEEHSRAELALLQASADQKASPDMKLASAKAALEAANKVIKAIKAVDIPSESYTPLSGAKKTQEDYQNRNADKPFPASSSGRRSAFAKWLTDPRNPLPARVAVNHIWMRHMGKPLVPTVFDFGRKGTPPTHPELLDWLACELVEHNWSMKHIHQLIVTSQTYRLSSSSSGAAAANLTADPENRFYWRMNPVRMEAQVVRDTLLHLAGELDLSHGGPSIPVTDETSRRRSLYFVHSHNDHQKFLSTFDDANVLDCYRRAESIIPQQALVLENSPLATAMATKIAERLATRRPDISDAEFVRTAFTAILTVEPTTSEQAEMSEILSRMTELARAKKRLNPEGAARINLVQSLLNHNDFITVR